MLSSVLHLCTPLLHTPYDASDVDTFLAGDVEAGIDIWPGQKLQPRAPLFIIIIRVLCT
jgi:hypothetical protein